jgi:phage terminase small subunit
MNDKQKLFAEEYLIDLNATQAAIRAGYSVKTANEQGARLLANVSVQNYIDELIGERKTRLRVTADNVLEHLSAVMRGKSISAVTVIETKRDGSSAARAFLTTPSEKERLKAAELLARYYRLFDGPKDKPEPIEIILRRDK